jgi:nitroreductase
MEFLHTLSTRQSVRRFRNADVPAELVHKLLGAAVQAPSAANQQAWAFAVVRGRDLLVGYSEHAKIHLMKILPQSLELHRRSDELNDETYNVFHGADTLLIVCSRPSKHSASEECCMAAQNILLAAHSYGLGACPVGFAQPWLNLPSTKNDLGIPQQYTVVLPVVIGWPEAVQPRKPERREPELVAWIEDTPHST